LFSSLLIYFEAQGPDIHRISFYREKRDQKKMEKGTQQTPSQVMNISLNLLLYYHISSNNEKRKL